MEFCWGLVPCPTDFSFNLSMHLQSLPSICSFQAVVYLVVNPSCFQLPLVCVYYDSLFCCIALQCIQGQSHILILILRFNFAFLILNPDPNPCVSLIPARRCIVLQCSCCRVSNGAVRRLAGNASPNKLQKSRKMHQNARLLYTCTICTMFRTMHNTFSGCKYKLCRVLWIGKNCQHAI